MNLSDFVLVLVKCKIFKETEEIIWSTDLGSSKNLFICLVCALLFSLHLRARILEKNERNGGLVFWSCKWEKEWKIMNFPHFWCNSKLLEDNIQRIDIEGGTIGCTRSSFPAQLNLGSYGGSVYIVSPNHPSNYPNGDNCAWSFRTSNPCNKIRIRRITWMVS